MHIADILETYDLSSLTATVVDISSNLPDAAGKGELVQFQFDGTQDQAVYLSNAAKTIFWVLAEATTVGDAGPFDCDALRAKGLTYIYGGGALTAGNMSIARVA